MAVVSMKQLLEAGVHFGHQTRRWNPKMAEYIYMERNGIYIIDLQKTVKKLEEAYAFVRSLAENGQSPGEVFTTANEKLCEGNDAELFITAWMGFLDLKTGMVHVANAGHNPPVLIRDGRAEYVVLKPGLMLAGMDGMIYNDQTLQLQKNDILYLYTDGVTEAMDADENQYGEDRLIELLSFGNNYPAPSGDNGIAGVVCEMVKADIDSFVKDAEQSDDITMLCVRYLGK